MATNTKRRPSRTATLPVADGLLSGAPYMVGSLPVYLLTDEGGGVGNAEGYATCALDGSADFAIATATTLAVGAPVYYITASKSLTTTSNTGANPLFGYAMEPKGSTAGQVIEVELAQV